MQVMSKVNAVHVRAGELQRQSYDPANPAHVALLESFWEALKPNTRRLEGDWTALGFQNGKAPQSDLRGMGMLGEFGKSLRKFWNLESLEIYFRSSDYS